MHDLILLSEDKSPKMIILYKFSLIKMLFLNEKDACVKDDKNRGVRFQVSGFRVRWCSTPIPPRQIHV